MAGKNRLSEYNPPSEPLRQDSYLSRMFQAYLSRVYDDAIAGRDQINKGGADDNPLSGIPRVALGGMSLAGAPISAAISPLLEPYAPQIQYGMSKLNQYVGAPVEAATGYPAEITNELALMAAPFGVGKAVKHSIPRLAHMGDTLGEFIGPDVPSGAAVRGSGPTPRGLTNHPPHVGSDNAPGPNAGEAIDATNLAFRVHPTDSQVAGNMKPGASLTKHQPLDDALTEGGFRVLKSENSTSNTSSHGPSASRYFIVEAPNGYVFKTRLSDHSYLAPYGGADLRYSLSKDEILRKLNNAAKNLDDDPNMALFNMERQLPGKYDPDGNFTDHPLVSAMKAKMGGLVNQGGK